ncbi:hypothetical protein BpHYR1_049976 [Brachionus plicatilis]|uniref:ALMS motif domain-containing protein n=1 Tax=Brachionus plicatilis TaxID=10195 RepID=A0A3M7Q122_BRAPC|nr:hypothetical protein BpHYR1_049976 [Brachionus plicatilis]
MHSISLRLHGREKYINKWKKEIRKTPEKETGKFLIIESIEPEQCKSEENNEKFRQEIEQKSKTKNQNFISKKLIELQKKKHEKRIKELEKLVKLEKIQIETLHKILKMDPNDSMYANTYQTYIDKKNFTHDQETLVGHHDQGEKNDKIDVENNLDRSLNETSQSQRENQTSDNESSIVEESENDDEHNPAHQESGIESSESSSERNVEKFSHDRAKISSWFCPIQPVKQTVSAPKPVVVKEKKPKIFEVKLESKNEEAFEKKIGLQEAFQIYKYDLLKNSRNRVKEIKIKAARRQVAKELKIDTLEQLNAKFSNNIKNIKQRQNEASQDKEKKINYFTIDKAMFSKNRHVMSSQEIVEQTKKKYQKLPEVQQKKLKQKLEETKIRNRIKSNIFKKTIQQKVLSSGPNFNLNFKALENQL